MKKFKVIFLLCLVVAMMFGFSAPAFATNLAGDNVVDCAVSVHVTAESGALIEGTLAIVLEDITGTAAERIEVVGTQEEWTAGVVAEFAIPAPTTYNVSFEGVADGYAVVDAATGEAIAPFAATVSGEAFSWSVIASDENIGEPESSGYTRGKAVSRENVTVVDAEAEAVYLEFLDAIAFIEDDSTWYNGGGQLLKQYGEDSVNVNIYSVWYEDYVQGGTTEEYFAMSAFEQFLWTETYTRFANGVNSNWGFDHFYGNDVNFRENITDRVTLLMTGNDCEMVKEAYLKLAQWQYEYVSENGIPFNFISNRSYIAEVKEEPKNSAEDPAVDPDSLSDEDMEEIQEIQEELIEAGEIPPAETEEETGIWTNALNAIASNALSVLICLVLAGALFVIIRIRKSKNSGNNSHDNLI